MKPTSLDELISKKAEEFAEQVRAAAAVADKEEEIRIEVENQLAFLKKEAGVRFPGKHEFTVASGRIDSVYNAVIIEYKNPSSAAARIGPGANSPGAKKVVEQIKKRFYDLRAKEQWNTLFGVGCDGNHFVFVRFYNDKWQVEDPVEVSKHSVKRFLWALFNLGSKGKRFEPDYLAGDFGSAEGSVASAGIKVLYDAISTTTNPKAQTFFNQWKILFGEVCGYDVDNPSDKIKKLADFYGVPSKGVKPAEMLFSVHTYYALFMKLLAGEVIGHFHKLPSLIGRMIAAPTAAKLQNELTELEAGGIFRHLGITNFLEGDLFAWYLPAWSDEIEDLVRKMTARLDQYNPGTLAEEPAESRDMLKKLYQQLFPKSVRHDLGEYYTPDWLAEHVLNELGYAGDPDKRLLDPACGSGTFLVMAITRIRAWYEKNREKLPYDEGELCKKILANVVGFDLNPLAVMAARTNYLIAIRDLVTHVDKVEIPVYLCDSIVTPAEYGDLFVGARGAAKVPCAAMKPPHLLVPSEIATNAQDVAKYAEQLEFCVRNAFEPKEFIQCCQDEGLTITSKSLHADLYIELVKLDKAQKNGVWARIIKNSFAPLFVGKVDFVAGNPPWVVWDNLPTDYRNSTKPIWERYGLFTLSGTAARHGGGKKDLSMLMLYTSADAYLADGGKLGFVITQTLFQTKGAGDGFRRFRIGDHGDWLGVTRVDDMVSFQPFDGAANWTSTVVLRKGKKTDWPVPYFKWSLTGELPDSTIDDWRSNFAIEENQAKPIDPGKANGPWAIKPSSVAVNIDEIIGASDYDAHLGANTGGANGVFWVRIQKKVGELVLIENVSEKSKAGIDSVAASIEPDLLYPLVRWLDVSRYHVEPSVHILMAQNAETRTGYEEAGMKRKWPRTYAYLKQFEALLRNRAAYKRYQGDAPFYSMYDIDEYTLASTKVVWRRMDKQINAAVLESVKDPVLGKLPAVPQETCVLVEVSSADEAHYLCAMLNSAVTNFIVKSHSVKGGKGFGTPSMLDFVPINRFKSGDAQHARLAGLSRKAHAEAARGADFSDLQGEIDMAAAAVFGVSKGDAAAMAKTIAT